MKVLRATIVRPLSGREQEVADLVKELDDHLAKQPGFIESYEIVEQGEGRIIGRIGVWENREAADNAATMTQTIALRSQVHRLSGPDFEERVMDIIAERRIIGGDAAT